MPHIRCDSGKNHRLIHPSIQPASRQSVWLLIVTVLVDSLQCLGPPGAVAHGGVVHEEMHHLPRGWPVIWLERPQLRDEVPDGEGRPGGDALRGQTLDQHATPHLVGVRFDLFATPDDVKDAAKRPQITRQANVLHVRVEGLRRRVLDSVAEEVVLLQDTTLRQLHHGPQVHQHQTTADLTALGQIEHMLCLEVHEQPALLVACGHHLHQAVAQLQRLSTRQHATAGARRQMLVESDGCVCLRAAGGQLDSDGRSGHDGLQ
mmetsp:Transcript_2474/g.5615  ORF Transcript_2474/g.5615 Transcript_2474/m.5615 type:complete len:261 (+) Transcript_2474:406-1188(+)